MILPRLSTTFVTCAKSDDGKDRDAGFADRQVLEQEVAAWLRHRNAKHAKADWRFTILHHNTHLSMSLKRIDYADRDVVPWGS